MTGRHGRRSALLVLALLLVGSGSIRIGSGIAPALAAVGEEAAAPVTENAEICISETPEILAALSAREDRIEERELQFADRMQALRLAEAEIDERLIELTAAEEKLRETLAVAETAAEDDLSKLVTVYENMKPKDAAALFEEMPPEFAAGFIGRMRPDAAAALMTGLNPATAYSISVVLAGRNAGVPSQ